MILWHGTTLDAAKLIARDGLKPDASRAYKQAKVGIDGLILNLRDYEPSGKYVFLAPNKLQAEWFAQYRTQYERLPYGAFVTNPPSDDRDGFQKLSTEVNPDAKPALLKINLTRQLRCEWDYASSNPEHPTYRCPEIIKPSEIAEVFPLEFNPEFLKYSPVEIVYYWRSIGSRIISESEKAKLKSNLLAKGASL